MLDKWGRNIDYLRVSVTDKCNLRCRYCIPEGGLKTALREEYMTLDETLRAVKLFSLLGISKVRITGGEPLAREGIVDFIKNVKLLNGIREVYMTTNGTLLGDNIDSIAESGIDGINISLDSLNPDKYSYITRGGDLSKVLTAVHKSIDKGIKVKINIVGMKNFNGDEILNFAALTDKYPLDIRFIELMPIGESKEFEAIGSDELKALISESREIMKLEDENISGGPAEYFKLKGGIGRIGFISPMSHSFCSSCNRIRLTSRGFVKQCLHWKYGLNLRDLIRSGSDDKDILEALQSSIYSKPLEHSFEKASEDRDTKYMSEIGG